MTTMSTVWSGAPPEVGQKAVRSPFIKPEYTRLFIIYLLQPYYRNYGKRIRTSPKVYVLDPGLATHLIGLRTARPYFRDPASER